MRNVRFTKELKGLLPEPEINPNKLLNNIIKSLPDVMQAAMVAKCDIEIKYKDGKIIVRTKNPISVLRDQDNNIIHVYEKKNGKES